MIKSYYLKKGDGLFMQMNEQINANKVIRFLLLMTLGSFSAFCVVRSISFFMRALGMFFTLNNTQYLFYCGGAVFFMAVLTFVSYGLFKAAFVYYKELYEFMKIQK